MALRIVLVTPEWSLERPGHRARLTCSVALVQDDEDRGFYEIRVALNGEPVYARVWDSHEAVMADADATRCDLLCVGWMPVGTLFDFDPTAMAPAH